MVIRQEINVDELFARAMSNCRKHFYGGKQSQQDTIMAYSSWNACLMEYEITWDFTDSFFCQDERQLSMFILKWS